jgi:hypothetical protein
MCTGATHFHVNIRCHINPISSTTYFGQNLKGNLKHNCFKLNDEEFELISIITIVHYILFQKHKKWYKFLSKLTMLIYLKKNT